MSFMNQALHIAKRGLLTCMPNPMVGCIIIKNNTIIGSGAHLKTGEHHAEIYALNEAGGQAAGADVYVTLEPCSHFGRTPPCVDALIKASVKSVHIAIADPNPLVAGKSIEKLRAAGIEVFVGECAQQAYDLNKTFFYYITQKKPFVIAKWAMSLDGKIAYDQSVASCHNHWITSEGARAHAHGLRAQVGAIIVGENTVNNDDPELTVRHGYEQKIFALPRPVILTPFGTIAHNSKLLSSGRNTLVMTSKDVDLGLLTLLDANNIEYCFVPLGENNCLDLHAVLDVLAKKHISSVLVEGGSRVLTSFFNENLVHQVYTYVAPKIIGGVHSLSPVIGNYFLRGNDECVLKQKEVIVLEQDICFISETELMPAYYETFLTQSKERSNV
jgi:diaminohydroxyphosphoribosylaminopyrimidine deaminase / 5-amino-6-(5-phosphoribosylamino)uracil reductase